MSNISQPAVQFCSGQAKPLLLVAGSLGLLGSIASIYFILQAATFDPLLIKDHDLKLYTRLAATLYLSLFAAFTLYAATSEQKAANKFLVILALINIGLAIGGALTIEDRVGLDIAENKTGQWQAGTWNKLEKQFNCDHYDKTELSHNSGNNQTTTTSAPSASSTTSTTPSPSASSTTSKAPAPSGDSTTPIGPGEQTLGADCKPKIDLTILILTIIFTSLASINLFILIVSGATVYKTYQYDEANQAAYS